jgi:hypothetical protein
MSLFLFRFWPVLIPFLWYLVWFMVVSRRAIKLGKEPPHFRNGPWYRIVLSSLLIAMGCFLVMYLAIAPQKGEYIPPHMENGVLVPSKVSHE